MGNIALKDELIYKKTQPHPHKRNDLIEDDLLHENHIRIVSISDRMGSGGERKISFEIAICHLSKIYKNIIMLEKD